MVGLKQEYDDLSNDGFRVLAVQQRSAREAHLRKG